MIRHYQLVLQITFLMNPGMLRFICCLVFLFTFFQNASAQCSSHISTFPYQEGFENNNGNWVPGGTASEWSWGTPIKPVINGAASGTKAWITGTLTQSSYSNSQNSTLTSPCFNFSGLTNPYIRFKLFWETEKKYDGASLQYSTNGGATWQLLGSHADYTACPSSNWFNTNSITALGSPGWSGNIQPTAPCPGGAGDGSGAWVTAQKSLSFLAGQSNVRFRFRFAAGNVCNNYDGFAVDDIWIGEAPTSNADFSFSCGASNQVSFTSSAILCNAGYSWNFDDPASGAENISTLANPNHFFSAAGEYNVRLVVTSSLSAPVTITKTVKIIELNVVQQNEILCAGDQNVNLSVTVIPAGNYNYSWNTTPVHTNANITGAGAGTYMVQVSGDEACPATESITITEPAALVTSASVQQPLCDNNNGSISINASGGVAGYSYEWNPLVSTTSSASGLAPGNYSVIIRDQNGCSNSITSTLINQDDLFLNLGNDTVICDRNDWLLQPGNYAFYNWQNGSSNPVFQVTESGLYYVEVGDNNGCIASDSIRISFDCNDLYFPNAITANNDGRNDAFGALGELSTVKIFSLRIYGRWGNLVYQSADPAGKWDGKFKGKEQPNGSYAWIAEYQLNGREPMVRKGTVTIIR